MIEVVTPSRLHITLIDLSGSLGRIDGSVGLTLDFPSMKINAREDAQLSVSGNTAFEDRIKRAASAIMMQHDVGGVAIEVVDEYPAHVGLGSGTQVALAVGTAMSELYDLHLTPSAIARLTGRGVPLVSASRRTSWGASSSTAAIKAKNSSCPRQLLENMIRHPYSLVTIFQIGRSFLQFQTCTEQVTSARSTCSDNTVRCRSPRSKSSATYS